LSTPDPCAAHQLQVPRGLEHPRGDLGRGAHEQGLDPLEAFDELVLAEARCDDGLEPPLAQEVEAIGVEVVSDEDANFAGLSGAHG